MKILLSIKPNFVAEITCGKKLYEFRKTLFRRKDINTIVVYSSSPVCRIVGEIEFDDVLCDSPDQLWNKTYKSAGISKDRYNEYFEGKDFGYAIKIKAYHPYSEPMRLCDIYPGVTPPQSFCYVE